MSNKELLDERIEELREKITDEGVAATQKFAAWWYALNWFSSFDRKVVKGNGVADINLNNMQCSYFSFSYSELKDKHFVLLCQPSEYWWIRDISVKCAVIEEDGIVIILNNLDGFGIYVTNISFKITFSKKHAQLLKIAKQQAKTLWLAELTPMTDGNNPIKWTPTKIHADGVQILDSPTVNRTQNSKGSFL